VSLHAVGGGRYALDEAANRKVMALMRRLASERAFRFTSPATGIVAEFATDAPMRGCGRLTFTRPGKPLLEIEADLEAKSARAILRFRRTPSAPETGISPEVARETFRDFGLDV
jgi:hypothetical protein